MKKNKNRKRGAPCKPATDKMTERLGVVQLKPGKLSEYEQAAAAENMSRSAWVRAACDARAKQAMAKKAFDVKE